MSFIKMYEMDHVGTRAEHLMDLHDMWSFAYGLLTTDIWHSASEKRNAEELAMALELLNKHIQSKYSDTAYARVINALPKPTDETST